MTVQDPSTIVLAGDSAGGGMVVSMLVTLRDRGLPLPAGAILISPWVDLTHSFPSVAQDNPLDYIPPYGFHQRPSPAWPPPNSDDIMAIQEGIVSNMAHKDHLSAKKEADAIQGFHVNDQVDPATANDTAADGTVTNDGSGPRANTVPGPGHNLSIMIDGKLIEVKDQIQMYASNQLISHPLVSPALQPSLGGLPPLLVMVGGGEMLRDEQIYLAHKAANPTRYPPGDAFLDESPHDHNRNQIDKWKPTDVQLQVWDDLCHVAPTLSFTRPAKYMYRSIAQFGAWALARAQKTEIEILDDDDISVISASESDLEDQNRAKVRILTLSYCNANHFKEKASENDEMKKEEVGKAGDPLPPFKNHMIRQRVDRHGVVRPLESANTLPGCQMSPADVGVVKEGPVRKWMAAKKEWDTKYASSKRRVQKQRAKEMAQGYQTFGDGEVPPPSALAGRRRKGDVEKEQKKTRSYGLSMWSMWGSKHDEKTMKNEEEADKAPETMFASAADGEGARALHDTENKQRAGLAAEKRPEGYSRSRSRRRIVKDENQTAGQTEEVDENTSAAELVRLQKANGERPINEQLAPGFVAQDGASDPVPNSSVLTFETASPEAASTAAAAAIAVGTTSIPTIVHTDTDDVDTSKPRPKANGIAFPFKLKRSGEQGGLPASSASIATLTSMAGVPPADDVRTRAAMSSGVGGGHSRAGSVDELSNITAESQSTEKEKEPLQRPPLDTFVTAAESLPTTSAAVKQ